MRAPGFYRDCETHFLSEVCAAICHVHFALTTELMSKRGRVGGGAAGARRGHELRETRARPQKPACVCVSRDGTAAQRDIARKANGSGGPPFDGSRAETDCRSGCRPNRGAASCTYGPEQDKCSASTTPRCPTAVTFQHFFVVFLF